MERITMKDLPKEQRPYEKCMAYGPKALTDSELLAVIIRLSLIHISEPTRP